MRVHIHIIRHPGDFRSPHFGASFRLLSGLISGCFCSGSQETDRTGRLRIFQEAKPGWSRKRFPFQLNANRVGSDYIWLMNKNDL